MISIGTPRLAALTLLLIAACTGVSAKTFESVEISLQAVRSYEEKFAYAAAESVYVTLTASMASSDSGSQRSLIEAYTRLAKVRIRLCRFDDAQSAYDYALLTATTVLGPENLTVAGILNGLGRIEHIRGNYGKSERLFRRSLRMAEKAGGHDHLIVAEALCGLSDVCRAGRRFSEGEDYARRALEIYKENPLTSPEDLALCHFSLGFNLRGRGAYNAAEQCYLSAQGVASQAFGEVHPVRAFLFNHQALLHNNLYQTDKALLCGNRALAIAEQCLGADHVEAGIAQYNLARAYTLMDQPQQALPHYERAIAIISARLGEGHPLLLDIKGFQSFCYRFMDRFDDAMAVARDVTVERLTNYALNSAQLDDRSSAIYSTNIYYAFSGYPTYYFDAPHVTEEQSRTLAQLAISSKGIVNDDIYLRRQALGDTKDPRARDLLHELGSIRSRSSALQLTDPARFLPGMGTELDSLREKEKDLLSILAEEGLLRAKERVSPLVDIDSICAQIPEGACLIEFYGYLYVPPTTVYTEETRFAAVVLDRHGIRAHVPIGANRHGLLIPFFDSRTALLHARSTGEGWDASQRDQYNQLMETLYDSLWAPIEPIVSDSRFILLGADNRIVTVSFAGLHSRNGPYLCEKYAFQYISSGRELLRYANPPDPGSGLFAVCDPDYDADPDRRIAAIDDDPKWREGVDVDEYAVRNIRPLCEKFDSLELSRLPNTRVEVDHIVKHWKESTLGQIEQLDGVRASEEALKYLSPGHRTIHIATHGYYVERSCRDEDPNESYIIQEPMLYSGLLLSGANLSGRGTDEAGAEDGIMTAHEVSSLNLRGTQTVILSACETALGELSLGHGAFGLARAFQMAGARQVVGALWAVSDAASIEAMEKIYSTPDKPIAEVLQEFAIEQINADRAAGRRTDPFYWAPYISYGDWRAR